MRVSKEKIIKCYVYAWIIFVYTCVLYMVNYGRLCLNAWIIFVYTCVLYMVNYGRLCLYAWIIFVYKCVLYMVNYGRLCLYAWIIFVYKCVLYMVNYSIYMCTILCLQLHLSAICSNTVEFIYSEKACNEIRLITK